MLTTFTDQQRVFLHTQRVGRLASAGSDGAPHAIPVCYVYAAGSLYIALDAKPKRVAPLRLRRVRNILENPRVALVVDHYSDDWAELAYLLIQGSAELLPPGVAEHSRAVELLRARYPQYLAMPIEQQPVIAIRPTSIVAWGAGVGD